MITDNPGIRCFIWEHANDINQILHRLAHAGTTISPKKSQVAWSDITLVGQKLTYNGWLPDTSQILKILKWPIPCNKTRSSWIFRTLWNRSNMDQELFPQSTTTHQAYSKSSYFQMDVTMSNRLQHSQESHLKSSSTSTNQLFIWHVSCTFSQFMSDCHWHHTLSNWRARTKMTSMIWITPMNKQEACYSQPKL